MTALPQRTAHQFLHGWATASIVINAMCAASLVVGALTVGLPFGPGQDPDTMRLGATFLAAAHVAGAGGSATASMELARGVRIDADVIGAFVGVSIPPIVFLLYAVLT